MAEYYDRNQEEAMNDVTRRQLMVGMMPKEVKVRLLEILETQPKASIPTLRAVLVNRVRHILGTAEAEKIAMELDNLHPIEV